MNIRTSLIPIVLAALASVLSAACTGPCIEETLEANAQYRVTVLELYNEDSTLAAWDPALARVDSGACERFVMAPMTSFAVTALTEFSARFPGSCTAWDLELTEFDGANIISSDPRTYWTEEVSTYDVVAGDQAELEVEGCAETWNLGIYAPEHGDIFRAPHPSELPPILIARRTNGSREREECGEAYASCLEYWIGTIERIE